MGFLFFKHATILNNFKYFRDPIFIKTLKTVVKPDNLINTNADITKIRNIGILAHVDAGKTSTTEMMLHACGRLKSPGHVDDGNTVTDFLVQERDRGITIMSSCVQMFWNEHQINIVDTPGHIDFNFEVERTLQVIDGAILLIDASSGVESQTQSVWEQLMRFKIPTVCYINKMDMCDENELKTTLQDVNALCRNYKITPLITQIPRFFHDINKQAKQFCNVIPLNSDNNDHQIKPEEYKKERCALIDTLAEIDDNFYELLMSRALHDKITPAEIQNAIHENTARLKCFPILFGSNFPKAANVPPSKFISHLLDAIVVYLPNPLQLNDKYFDIESSNGPIFPHVINELNQSRNTYFTVFKLLNHTQYGLIAFVRVYSGTLFRGSIYHKINRENLTHSQSNLKKERPEKINEIWNIQGEALVKTDEAKSGSIVVLSGLTKALTGDIYVTQFLNNVLTTKTSMDPNKKADKTPAEITLSFIRQVFEAHSTYKSLYVPEPMFFCEVTAHKPSEQRQLENALTILAREDPSLRVSIPSVSNSTNVPQNVSAANIESNIYNSNENFNRINCNDNTVVLSGLGDLHIQIVKDRLRTEFNGLQAYLGPLKVNYKEMIHEPTRVKHTIHKLVNGRKIFFGLDLELYSTYNDTVEMDLDILLNDIDSKSILGQDNHNFKHIEVVHSRENNLTQVPEKIINAIEKGMRNVFAFGGPIQGSPIIYTGIKLHGLTCLTGNNSNPANNSNVIAPQIQSQTLQEAICDHLIPPCLHMLSSMAFNSQENAENMSPNVTLLEPYVLSSICKIPLNSLSILLSNLKQKRCNYFKFNTSTANENFYDLKAIIPLIEMADFSNVLRNLTSGKAWFKMKLLAYHPVAKY